ncbi:TIGR04282 family arsenosugar biosynthesis glycosyltransferase [Altibacter sp.]|uniref:TIGR04282 family arsenosugar biosynthesis glycosyltransferase n=1 Tax=Altibacter sp. TaxID=2024823 RepID=UPI000C96B905|nr:TIGR04282 family arsenosugar biosynthesis glycosyltransferase [Altibacter sp.]MAP55297.1 glycosyltransferase [Altibacter sp.]
MGVFTTNNDNSLDSETDFWFPTSKKALLIFTRNPELGKCKTRLAATIGDEAALRIYTFLLKHTVTITKALAVDKFVFYSDEIGKDDLWDNRVYHKRMQHGKDLGSRMENAFQQIFESGYEQAIIIGSDLYDLDLEGITAAFKVLDTKEVVLGPAEDGGYYLLGIKKIIPQLFRNKAWGTDTVLQDTLTDLANNDIFLLPEKNDVDRWEDIAHLSVFKQFLTSNQKSI